MTTVVASESRNIVFTQKELRELQDGLPVVRSRYESAPGGGSIRVYETYSVVDCGCLCCKGCRCQ